MTRDDAMQDLVDGLRAEIEDIRGGYAASTAALDRFRDVVCEVTGYGDENPGDDVVIAKLREMHDKTGPEPTRWRDFMVGANAARDQILAHHAAGALEAAQRPPVSPEAPDDALIEAMARALNPFAWKVRDKYMSHPDHEALELDVMVEDSIRQARAAYAALAAGDPDRVSAAGGQRPQVSSEQREALIEALLKVPGNELGPAHGEPGFWPYFSDDEEDRRDAGRFVDAILARLSLPPVSSEQREAIRAVVGEQLTKAGLDLNGAPYSDDGETQWPLALELRDCLTAALLARFSVPERPQVSSEQREALVGAGIKALVESPEVPTGVRALLLGEVVTIREAVDAEPVVRVVLDAILAQLSGMVNMLDLEPGGSGS